MYTSSLLSPAIWTVARSVCLVESAVTCPMYDNNNLFPIKS